MLPRLHIAAEEPRAPEVLQLLAAHLDFARGCTPPEDAYALDPESLNAPGVTFYTARLAGDLLAVGALQDLGEGHLEIKSMHPARRARGMGIGRAMLRHLVSEARTGGGTRLSLETGSMAAFAAARGLYQAEGFTACPPYADYQPSPNTTFMTLSL